MALMWLIVILALLVCASSLWMIPDGHGSFSVVHGSATYFQAWRNAVRVRAGIRLAIVIASFSALAIPVFWISRFAPVPGVVPLRSERLSLIHILTC
jgi:hypothetical protein